MPSEQNSSQMTMEMAAAVASALVAAYVRGRSEQRPWHWRALLAKAAEAIVCGFLAISAAAFMEWTDPRTTVGLSAALGLIGTEAIRDLIMRVANRKADS